MNSRSFSSVDEEPHLERLVLRPVLLRADVRDVELVPVDHAQHLRHAPRHVAQRELQKHDARVVRCSLKIPDLLELPVCQPQLRLVALRIDKERVRIDRLVVADPRYVDPVLLEKLTRLEESADVVGHCCDIRLLHAEMISQHCKSYLMF